MSRDVEASFEGSGTGQIPRSTYEIRGWRDIRIQIAVVDIGEDETVRFCTSGSLAFSLAGNIGSGAGYASAYGLYKGSGTTAFRNQRSGDE